MVRMPSISNVTKRRQTLTPKVLFDASLQRFNISDVTELKLIDGYEARDLEARNLEANDLLKIMLSGNPTERPTAGRALKHPFFWDKEKQLAFFQDVSDRIENEEEGSEIMKALESNSEAIVKDDWKKHIKEDLQENLDHGKHRKYKGTQVKDLLRAIRNKKHHYQELQEELRQSLGAIPKEYVTYFISRFPMLFIHTYNVLVPFCQNEPQFETYYKDINWS